MARATIRPVQQVQNARNTCMEVGTRLRNAKCLKTLLGLYMQLISELPIVHCLPEFFFCFRLFFGVGCGFSRSGIGNTNLIVGSTACLSILIFRRGWQRNKDYCILAIPEEAIVLLFTRRHSSFTVPGLGVYPNSNHVMRYPGADHRNWSDGSVLYMSIEY